jgi:LemA protein
VIALWIVLGVVALFVISFIVGFNRLVRLRNEVSTGWSNIDVQLKRRADLIPNLVEAVKGYAAHERGVFDSITEARSSLLRADTPGAAGQANDMLTTALGRLFAVAEAYPDLKASQNFLRLQDELADTEDKIAAARRYYNATVMRYNTKLQSFPGVVYARALGFTAREFFSAEEGDHALPQVDLTPPTA